MSKLIQQYEGFKKAANLAIQETSYEGLASDVLTRVVIETIRKYQEKISVGIQDSASDLLNNFKQNLSDSILRTNWTVPNKDPFLFPKDCRFAFNKGDSTILAIEQNPQIRTILLKDSMRDDYKPVRSDIDNGSQRWSLAMPYVVFIVYFKKDIFSTLYCGWRTRPLSSLTDTLIRPLLPNIRNNLSVCMAPCPTTGNLNQQAERVINYFWNSEFNEDLADKWWQKIHCSPALKNVPEWRKSTVQNPLFILDVNLTPSDIEELHTVEYFLDVLTRQEDEPDANNLRHKLTNEVDKCADALFASIHRYLKKTKFERFHPQDVKDQLCNIMKSSNNDFIDLIFVLKHEIEKHKNELKPKPQITEPLSPLWNSYHE